MLFRSGFSLDEIDGSGNAVNNLALFDVVPSVGVDNTERDDEQFQVGYPGITAGDNSFIFNGASGTPNYVGWDIVISELTGRGIMVRGLDYSWDANTATFTLLQAGDVFQPNQWYNVHFNSRISTAGYSVPATTDFQIEFLNTNTANLNKPKQTKKSKKS